MRALDNIRVLEMGQVIAGPYAGLLLADMGAEVIKVEQPGIGDSARNPQITALDGHSATFLTFSRNKKSVELNLKDPGDHERFVDLVRTSDVVIHNYLPEVAERLGVTFQRLHRENPRIITCAISGFGTGSPYEGRPSYDLIHQAMSGYMMLTGAEGDPPTRVGVPLADLSAGLFASHAVLAALHARERTGHGDAIDVSMYDCLLSFLGYQATLYLTTGEKPLRMGSSHEHVVPWQAFRTADGYVVVAARVEHFWRAFCRAVGLEALLDDERFIDNRARLQHRAELVDLIERCLMQSNTGEWLQRLESAGVPAAPVRDVADALDDAHVQERGLAGSYRMADREIRVLRSPVHVRGSAPVPLTAPPALGQDQPLIAGRRTEPTDGTSA